MHCFSFFTSISAILLVNVGSLLQAAPSTPPNIVVILSDDQGYADISYNPNHLKEVNTPHMDALAKESVFFNQGYTSGHVCSPTRAGLMIGSYQHRVGVYTAGQGGKGFNPNIPIFPSFLPDAYRSTAIGKWHLGLDDDYPELKHHAMNRGFDECYKFMGRGGHDYYEAPNNKDAKKSSPIYRNKVWEQNYEGYLTTKLTEEAVNFIDRNKAQPFFLYLAYNAVHSPAQAPEEDVQRYMKEFPHITRERAILMAMLYHLDEGVGEVVSKLKSESIWNNTLLFFLSDNGGSKGMEANNGILKGYKQNLSEGGIRTPFIVSWPDQFKGGKEIDTPVISFDILPTVLDAIDSNRTEQGNFDGKSILPLLKGKRTNHHETLFWNSGKEKNEWAVRQGKWKLHSLKGKLALYNLEKDPSEANDLAEQYGERVASLELLHTNWLKDVQASEKESKLK